MHVFSVMYGVVRRVWVFYRAKFVLPRVGFLDQERKQQACLGKSM